MIFNKVGVCLRAIFTNLKRGNIVLRTISTDTEVKSLGLANRGFFRRGGGWGGHKIKNE